MRIKSLIATIIIFSLPNLLHAAEYLVEQKDKAFSQIKLKVKVGDKVEFKNADPFNHNIFSLSDTQMFDLGSYPKGESRKVTFEQVGTVDVECAVHPAMKLTVEVAQ